MPRRGACCFLPHLRPPLLPPPSSKRASTKSTAALILSQTGSAACLHYLLFLWHGHQTSIAATEWLFTPLRRPRWDF
ncbi:hypothetical protein B296_00041727 [Ensete ventricosum]|uniref:Uncharacterized protein n=1 Tax=Ensete ventricosum TaxID=4639 RepID=A0A426Y616_ENSVE|nr:hypothetical protein B296_00041727 [Ensete ventricosum]